MQAAPGPSGCGTGGSRILPEQWFLGRCRLGPECNMRHQSCPDSALQSIDSEWKRWWFPAFFGSVHIAGTAPAYPSGWSRSIE